MWVSRPLSAREADVVTALLGAVGEPVPATLEVDEACGCGCPTVTFVHDPCEIGATEVVVATVAGTTDAVAVLRAACGGLGSLECLPLSGDDPPSEFPPPSSLMVQPPAP